MERQLIARTPPAALCARWYVHTAVCSVPHSPLAQTRRRGCEPVAVACSSLELERTRRHEAASHSFRYILLHTYDETPAEHTHEQLSDAGVVGEEHRHRPLLLLRTPWPPTVTTRWEFSWTDAGAAAGRRHKQETRGAHTRHMRMNE
eukprot:scaffold25528_cov123-Isochrysis_galbana.AAC.2